MLSTVKTTDLSHVRNMVQESCYGSQFHAVELTLRPSSFSFVYSRPDLGNPSLHNRGKYQRIRLLLQLQCQMQTTLSPSPATPADTDHSNLLTLHVRPKEFSIEIKLGNLRIAHLGQHTPPSHLCDNLCHLLPLQLDRTSARSSQGPQDRRCLLCSLVDHINCIRWPHSSSALSQNWGI